MKRYKWVSDAFWWEREFMENLIVDMAFVQNIKGWNKKRCVAHKTSPFYVPAYEKRERKRNRLKCTKIDVDDDVDDVQRLIHSFGCCARLCLFISICFYCCKIVWLACEFAILPFCCFRQSALEILRCRHYYRYYFSCRLSLYVYDTHPPIQQTPSQLNIS